MKFFLDAIARLEASDRLWQLDIATLGARGNEKALEDARRDLIFEKGKRNPELD